MQFYIEIKKAIDSCQIDELEKIFKNYIEIINFELELNNESVHWLDYLYEHCGKNSVNKILDSKIIDCNLLKKKNISLVWKSYLAQKYELVELLLNNGASSIVDEGYTLLHWVVSNGDIEMLKIILLNHKNINLDVKDLTNEDKDRTPLHWAAQENQIENGGMLLEHGANIEARNINGKTALHIAASSGNKEFVKLLIEAGADKQAKDNSNLTPKRYAELYGHNFPNLNPK